MIVTIGVDAFAVNTYSAANSASDSHSSIQLVGLLSLKSSGLSGSIYSIMRN